MGKHTRRWLWRQQQRRVRRRVVDVVDAGTLVEHQLTPDALEAGRRLGSYVALCGARLLPAALVEPGQDTCRSCRQVMVS